MPNTSPKRRREKQTKTSQPAQIYELKITLRRSKPPIWRRIAVAADIRLSSLHQVIQVVMGWGNYHLHQFVVRNRRARPMREELASLSRQEQYERLIMCRDRYWSDPRMEIEGAEDEKKMKLCDLAPVAKSDFIYEYDFGDGWEHEIKVVKIGPPVEGVKYPVCIAGKLACPPEDCGGIWGYYDMLEALKDPKHKQHKEFIEWIGGKFDPERFNLDEVNATLRRLR